MKTELLSYFSAAKNTHNKLSSGITVCHIVPDAKDISSKNELSWTKGISVPRLHFKSIGGHII